MPVTSTGATSKGVTSQGTIILRNGVAIAELQNITPPALTRKALETTTQNSSDDSYVVGIRRKGELQFDVNFLPSGDGTHNGLTGLLAAWGSGSLDEYRILFAQEDGNGHGAIWLFSGYVDNIAPKNPVDGVQSASVSIRPSGGHIMTP